MSELQGAIDKLRAYAYARDRVIDREERTIILTDDEAVALLAALDSQREES